MEEREERIRQEANQGQAELLQQIQQQQKTQELLQQQIEQQNQQHQRLMNYFMSQNQMTSPPGSGPSTFHTYPSFMVSG